MFTSLLGDVNLTKNAWTDVLSLDLDPGVWVLMATTWIDSDGGANWDSRFTDGTTMFGSAGTAFRAVQQPSLGVADLSLALAPTTVKFQVFISNTATGTFWKAKAGSLVTNTATATWLMAFVDASSKLDDILAAVRKTYPAT